LAVSCTADVEDSQGELVLELCKGGRRFQCRFDLATGRAVLSISGTDMAQWRPSAQTGIQGKGRHDLVFSNCDRQLLLWVDGSLVSFDRPTDYQDLDNATPDETDLSPVGIAAAGAPIQINHLRVMRDIYYLALSGDSTNPRACDVLYLPEHAVPDERKPTDERQDYVDFPLRADQFFVLGDNSARSKDGRLWGQDNYWVPRDLVIGKALVLSWPRQSCNIPLVNLPFSYAPNVSRMGLIR
jgi:hypothetical protein